MKQAQVVFLSTLAVMSVVCTTASTTRAELLHATDDANDRLYTIETTNGNVTIIGSYTLNSPSSESFIGGLEFNSGGTLYGISARNNARLYTLNPADATTTDIGALGVGFVFEGGLAFDPTDGTLYGVNQGNSNIPNLFTINTATGAGNVVGQIAGGIHDFAGLVFDGGQLFGIDRLTDALWRIDKTTPGGAGTVQVGLGLGDGISMGDVGGMTRGASGTVYGYSSDSTDLFTINLAAGTGNVIHTFGFDDPVFYSLAARAGSGTIPEPSTFIVWGLLVFLGAGIYGWRPRRSVARN